MCTPAPMLLKKTSLWWIVLWISCLNFPAHAAAHEDEDDAPNASAADASSFRTLWILEGRSADAQEKRLREVLASSPRHRHLVGQQDIEDAIRDNGLSLPNCIEGTGSCKNARAAAMQTLRLQRFVRLNLQRKGHVEAFVYNEDGRVARHFETSGSSTQHAIMDAISQITDATGRLRIDTTPPNASVHINGKEHGKTPFDRTMNVGSYDVEVHLPGYATVHETIDVPPEGRARRSFTLERRAATLIVRSGTPTAVVRIDDDPAPLPTNEALLIEPGVHRITVLAEGYEPVSEHFDFEAGHKRELNATLALSMQQISKQHVQRIVDRPILLQLGLRYMHFKTDWAGARGRNNNDRITCTLRPTTGECDASSVHSIGLDLSAIYTWKYLDLEVFGLSVYSLAQPSKSIDFELDDPAGARLSHHAGNRTLVRVGHVGGRYLINEHFEPFARLGFSFAADRVRARDLQSDGEIQRFKRASVLLELRGGLRVHVNELLYGYGDIGVGFDLSHSGNTPAFELGAGIGVNLPSPFQRKKKTAGSSKKHAYDALPQEL